MTKEAKSNESYKADATPPIEVPDIVKVSSLDTENLNFREYLTFVFQWTEPRLSAKYLFTLLLTYYFTSGEKGYDMIVFLSLVMVLRVLVVFGLRLSVKELEGKEGTPLKTAKQAAQAGIDLLDSYFTFPVDEDVKFFTVGVAQYLEDRGKAFFGKLRRAESEPKALKIVLGHFLGLVVIMWTVDVKTLFFLSFGGGLTVLPAYRKFKPQIDPLVDHLKKIALPYMKVAHTKMKTMVSDLKEKIKAKRGGSEAAEDSKKEQ